MTVDRIYRLENFVRTVINCHSLPSEISFTGWRHFADGREISLRSRKCDEISPFVSAKYRCKRREISLELSSELLTKVCENKERNSRNSLRLLLHNTVFCSPWKTFRSQCLALLRDWCLLEILMNHSHKLTSTVE